MRTQFARSVTAAAVALIATFAAGDLAAQQPQTPEPPEPPEHEELVTFTEAYIEVDEVRSDIMPKVAATQDEAEIAALQQEATERMVAILEDHEMEPERYGEITMVLNADAELRAEFEAIYEELIDPGSGDA